MEPYDELVKKAEKELRFVKEALAAIKQYKTLKQTLKELLEELEDIDPDYARRTKERLKNLDEQQF